MCPFVSLSRPDSFSAPFCFSKAPAVALAKILSAGQKETGMTGIFERHQIINTPQNLYKSGTLQMFACRLPRLASPLLNGCGSAKRKCS
jgi:hypothetical protein